jgi:glycerol-3-phosphate dehydrogenase
MTKRQERAGTTCRSPWDARGRQLERLAAELFDVLVVGGGVTGCGIALDAASRGLSVALIEKRDFAAGTSSRSSKLIHGGLRYLEQFDLGLVREALHERRLLAERLAPHLVHPTPFLLPLEHGLRDHVYFGAGLTLYDALAGIRPAVPRHRHLSHETCLRKVPALKPDAITGGICYYDAQVDDARFAVTLAGTASAQGACCVPAVEVTEFLHDGAAVAGVRARDLEDETELDVRARVTINATGVWTTEMERLAGVASPLPVRPSKGVHIVVPRDRIDSELALILPTEKSVLFVLPWGSHWIVGTTDTPWEFGLDHPAASRTDIEYLLGHANAVLRRPLTEEDITAVFVGLRPLVAEESRDTAAVSREHVVHHGKPGLVSIAGGKYTTYRVMARDAVDVAAGDLPFPVSPSRTQDLPLLGAVGSDQAARRAGLHPGAAGLSSRQVGHLARRYGTLALRVLDLVVEDPSLVAPLEGADTYLSAEVRYAVLNEAALHVDDVLTRRTHIAFEAEDRGRRAVEGVARMMAVPLGWDAATVDHEIGHYQSRLDAETAAQAMLDDAGADAARAPVRDVRLERERAGGVSGR